MIPEIADGAVLTTGEVAGVFNVHPNTVVKWARAGKLACFFTLGGHRRYRSEDVRALLDPEAQAEFAEAARRRVPGADR